MMLYNIVQDVAPCSVCQNDRVSGSQRGLEGPTTQVPRTRPQRKDEKGFDPKVDGTVVQPTHVHIVLYQLSGTRMGATRRRQASELTLIEIRHGI